ncbi:MAG: FAD-dependent thymidylate synthase [Bacteroidales bacterium]|nr:FAD-dependent thymidylate synthase [Bacteroidales bacterium]
MGKIIILPETTKDPISLMGRRAGICWGADITDQSKNYARGLDCIKCNHGRVLEFVNIETIIEGYSARVIREWYTHIGGAPTRLQGSTRYINYADFDYIVPKSIKTEKQRQIYCEAMENIRNAAQELENNGIPREDSALVLPLGMETIIVDKRNVRNVMDMSRQRQCTRAYWEYRDMFKDYLEQLSNYSEEWKTLISMTMMPKCEMLGYCPERYSCGRKAKRVA